MTATAILKLQLAGFTEALSEHVDARQAEARRQTVTPPLPTPACGGGRPPRQRRAGGWGPICHDRCTAAARLRIETAIARAKNSIILWLAALAWAQIMIVALAANLFPRHS